MAPNNWQTIDRDLDRLSRVEIVTMFIGKPIAAIGLTLAFLVIVAAFGLTRFGFDSNAIIITIGAVFAAYMALNIGANDVANNMGPAVGAKVLRVGIALGIAAICEAAGAVLAGGKVTATVSSNIVDPTMIANSTDFMRVMLSSSVAAAIWVNLATSIRAPVSTTHSVIGAVVGAGIIAAGLDAVNWPVMGRIAASWVISPVMGGVIAAIVLAAIKLLIIYRDDKIAAARTWLPVFLGLMAGAFSAFLLIKGLNRVLQVSLGQAMTVGVIVGLMTYALSVPIIAVQSKGMENRNKSLKQLFRLPLIVSAALLSFAHGANDVANAVGPLAGIIAAANSGAVAPTAAVPFWILCVGALGISLGLLTFGPRLIRMVGRQITKLNAMRAFSVALSTALTVLVASVLGMPVSSTHIAIGAVFGVGLFREWFLAKRREGYRVDAPEIVRVAKEEYKRRKLVRRSHMLTILAAWVVTVPAAGTVSCCVYLLFGLAF